MKPYTRELLVTTKVAQHWQSDFEQQVDELMSIVAKVDTEQHVLKVTEVLDVYHNTTQRPKGKRKKVVQSDKPFEFLAFYN